MFKEGMLALVGQGFIETIYMTVISTILAYIIGLPLGLVLVVTDPLHSLPDSPDCADALHKNGGRHHHRCEGGDCRSLDCSRTLHRKNGRILFEGSGNRRG